MFETLTMRAGLLVALALVALLAGAGCDKRSGPLPTPPLPSPPLPTAAPTVTPQASGDPSLPDAQTALRAGAAQASASDAQRSAPAHPAMTRAQEATAMPLPGQANDHSSLALDPPPKRAASAP